MAFDMSAGDRQDCIDHPEEYILQLAAEKPAQYPELCDLWVAFYNGPSLSPEQAGALVHELLDLLLAHGGASNRPMADEVMRLMAFFSHAYRRGLKIDCQSD